MEAFYSDADESDTEFEDGSSDSTYTESFNSSDSSDDDNDSEIENLLLDVPPASSNSGVKWADVTENFVPRKAVPDYKATETTVPNNSSGTEIFLKLFPKSLLMFISDCTNERLNILSDETKKDIKLTDYHEIMIVIGCIMVMAYNRVPHVDMYWSKNKSLENLTIKSAIARDRFKKISSKLYFNKPVQPENASKTYYVDELIQCFKHTFQKARTESTFQSIDESMIKFKGRSSMKQYMPKKPIKRGIKAWTRSDAETGYIYDLNIYSGKETEAAVGTLGERVVNKLCSTIRTNDVAICIDRFFTSVNLMNTLPFACAGTIMANRKDLPDLPGKFERGKSIAKSSDDGLIAIKWQDTKEVTLVSNCHNYNIATVDRRLKDGSKKTFECPEAIQFYNKHMAGVDLSDQFAVMYDIDRKSTKWWRRVFQRLLMNAASNSWILYQQSNKSKMSFIEFLVPLSENLIEMGIAGTKNHRKMGVGRPSKRSKTMVNVRHLPIVIANRRRCRMCALNKIYQRTLALCNTCDVPLCISCFVPYHT